MSKLQTDRRYVAYPRKAFGREYGSIEQLEALGRFCTAFSWSFFGVTILIYFLEYWAALTFAYWRPLDWLTTGLLAIFIWLAIGRKASHLAAALGWHRSIAIFIGFLFVPLSAAAVYGSLTATMTWLIPYAALIAASVGGLRLARDEIRRYGIQVSGLSSTAAHEQFERALIKRRVSEENPRTQVPTDLYSDEPPSYG